MDPHDYIGSLSFPLDAVRLGESIGSAVNLAQSDPVTGLGAVIRAGNAVGSLVGGQASIFGAGALTVPNAISAATSLSYLRGPLETIGGALLAKPYGATIHSLASVASVGDTIRSVYGLAPTTLELSTLRLGATVGNIQLATGAAATQWLAPPYLASASAVYSVETSFARLTGASGDTTLRPLSASAIAIRPESLGVLHSGITSLSTAAYGVWESMRRDNAIYASASSSILRSPAVELYASAQVAAAVSLDESEMPDADDDIEAILVDTSNAFEGRLAALDQNLVELFRGAVGAIERGGPDWQRHSMTSLRELSTQVLHMLAPDSLVLPSARPSDFHKGRLTRKARLHFIFGASVCPEMTAFFEADSKAALALFDLLSGGTHRLGNKATPGQLHYLRSRLVGLLTSMLEARGF